MCQSRRRRKKLLPVWLRLALLNQRLHLSTPVVPSARSSQRLPPYPVQPQRLQRRLQPLPTIWFPSARKIPKRQIGLCPIAAK
jgi:hypothetical protein